MVKKKLLVEMSTKGGVCVCVATADFSLRKKTKKQAQLGVPHSEIQVELG